MFTNTFTAQLEFYVSEVDCVPVVAVKRCLAELTNARRKRMKLRAGKMISRKRSLCKKLQKYAR